MSNYDVLSREDLGKKHALYDDDKQGHSVMATSVGSSPNSKIPLMKDNKSSNEPNRIGFLNQCKLELSAEVIRWKEENHRLRKEKETSEQKICELQSVLDKLSRRNEELEASLLSSNHEYEKLRMHSLAINEENKHLHRKLSKTCSKYYSYPWSEFGTSPMLPFVNGGVHHVPKTDIMAAKSWEEVSEKLIEQMKQEMKELQELGQKLAINELPSRVSGRLTSSSSLKDDLACSDKDGEVENGILNLTHDLESLKEHLRAQQQKLSMLLNQASPGTKNLAFSTSDNCQIRDNIPSTQRSVESLIEWENVMDRKFVRPSDDSFRAYFTQQLNNSKSTEELKHMMNFYLDGNKGFEQSNTQNDLPKGVEATSFYSQLQPKERQRLNTETQHYQDPDMCTDVLTKPVNSADSQTALVPEEERVCPICEAVFPRVFSQKEFESHVVAHLEAESASLLDQYEIL